MSVTIDPIPRSAAWGPGLRGRAVWLLLSAFLAGAACSSIPSQVYPEHRDLRLRVDHRVPEGQQRWVRVPATDRHLRVFSLLADPAATAERYDGQGRWLRSPTGPLRFSVTAHLRDFGSGGQGAGSYRPPDRLFPDADAIHELTP